MCIKIEVGMNVRNFRIERGWSQTCLAQLAGVNQGYIGCVERGENQIGIVNLGKIAKALQVSPAKLLEHDPAPLEQREPVEFDAVPELEPDPNAPFIHGPTFLTMVQQCVDSPDAILNYLKRSGVRVLE